MRAWLGTFAANGLIFGAGLLSSILAARFLGVEDRGLLAAIIFWPHLIAGLANMGLNESIVVHSARNGTSRSLRSTALTASILLATAIAIPAVFAMPELLRHDRQDFVLFTQCYVAAYLPLTFIAQNLLAVDQGEQRFGRFNVQRILQAICYPLLLAAFWSIGLLDPRTAAIAVFSGIALVAILRTWQSRRSLLKRPCMKEGLKLLGEGCRIHTVNLISHLNSHLDKLALVLLASDRQLGLYVVALTAAGATAQLFVQTYVNIMLPRVADWKGTTDHYSVAHTSLLLLVGLVLVASVVLLPLMPWLIQFLFGAEFSQAAFPAQILILATAALAIKKAVIYLLRSKGIHRPAIQAEIITAIVLGATVFPALSTWGVAGVCFSLAGSQTIGLVYAVIRFKALSVRNRAGALMEDTST